MQLVILAGGKGTRLKGRSGNLPKCLVDVAGKPLLAHQFHYATSQGVTDVVLMVGHLAEAIREYCGDGHKWNLNIRYYEETEPLGTAGAVLRIANTLDSFFFVLYGDLILNVDLNRMRAAHVGAAAGATILLHPNDHPYDSDLVETDSVQKVTGFHHPPHAAEQFLPNLVNAGLYAFQRDTLVRVPQRAGMMDFVADIFPHIRRISLIHGYVSPEYIKDAGTLDRLDHVTADIRSGRVSRGSLATPAPAVLLDRDGTITEEVGRISTHEQLNLIDGVAEAIRTLNKTENRAVVVTNQPVIARGDCTEEELQKINNKMSSLLGLKGAYLDALYFCPHHPDKGFPGERAELKIACECRKPEIGLIARAQQELNLDLSRSWLIGDTTRDVECARRAGIQSILLHTGYGGRDAAYSVRPDYEFDNLSQAADFISNRWHSIESVCRTLADGIDSAAWVIVGGTPFSGKSTFASVLRHVVEASGRPATVVPLDSWFDSARTPKQQDDIFRQMRTLLSTAIAKNSAFSVPFLPSHAKLDRLGVLEIAARERSLYILEGAAPLFCEELRSGAGSIFFVNCPEEVRRERLMANTRFRGYSANETERLYAQQWKQADTVTGLKQFANYLIEGEFGDY